jgi:hypothetical protein
LSCVSHSPTTNLPHHPYYSKSANYPYDTNCSSNPNYYSKSANYPHDTNCSSNPNYYSKSANYPYNSYDTNLPNRPWSCRNLVGKMYF